MARLLLLVACIDGAATLRVDLGQLDREGSVTVEGSVSAEDELWKDSDLSWAGDVAVKLRASFAGTGGWSSTRRGSGRAGPARGPAFSSSSRCDRGRPARPTCGIGWVVYATNSS